MSSGLLAELLNRQVDLDEPAGLDDMAERWFVALRQGERLSPLEIALIWRSPVARRAYLDTRRQVARELQALHATAPIELLAASSQVDRLSASAEWGQVRAVRVETGEWLITAEIDPHAFGHVPEGFSVQIRDEGGHVWFTIDPRGTDRAERWWSAADSPLERLQKHKLFAEMV